MPDNSIECILGRLEEKISNLEESMDEIKREHREISKYILTQKTGYKLFWMVVSILGTIAVFFKDIIQFLSDHFVIKANVH